jgi:hypothetical protein
MSNRIQIINEQIGNFMMTPTLPPPPISAPPSNPINNTPSLNQLMQSNQQYAIDNDILYRKLIEIENELKSLKNMVNSLNYPRPTYYPAQQFTPPSPQTNTFWSTPNPYGLINPK